MLTDNHQTAGSPAAPTPRTPRWRTKTTLAESLAIGVVLAIIALVAMHSQQSQTVHLGAYKPAAASPAPDGSAAPKGSTLSLPTGCPLPTTSADQRQVAESYLEIIQAAWANQDPGCLDPILTPIGGYQPAISGPSPIGPGGINVTSVKQSSDDVDGTSWDISFLVGSNGIPRYAEVGVTQNGGVTTFNQVPDFSDTPPSNVAYGGL